MSDRSLEELLPELEEESTSTSNRKPLPPGKKTTSVELICFDAKVNRKYIDFYCKNGLVVSIDRYAIKVADEILEYIITKHLPVKIKGELEVMQITSLDGEMREIYGRELYSVESWEPVDIIKEKVLRGKAVLKKTGGDNLALIVDTKNGSEIYVIPRNSDTEMVKYAESLLGEAMRQGQWKVSVVYNYCLVNNTGPVPLLEGIFVMPTSEALKLLKDRKGGEKQ